MNSFEDSCASCRHWMCGSLSKQYRLDRHITGLKDTCHVKQPTKTHGDEPACDCYERAVMTE